MRMIAKVFDIERKTPALVRYIILTRRVPVQRAVERNEIPYPYKVHDTTLHSRA